MDKGILKNIIGILVLSLGWLSLGLIVTPAQASAQAECGQTRYFLGMPSWDRGVDCTAESSVWLESEKTNPVYIIISNIIAIATQLAGMVAVGFVILGGLKYILSTGNPDQATAARRTLINALIGVVIAIMGRVLVEAIYNNLVSAPSSAQGLPKAPAEDLVDGVLNLTFIILGGISLIVMVLQGIKYSLSSGNPEQTNQARNGIIYALVGLTVAISAWSIVNFAIERVIQDSTTASAGNIANLLINIAGFIVFIGGVITTIMVIVGAIKYILSGGNPEQTARARNTIIYALVGLVIFVLAGPIISFVLSRL